MMLGEVLYVLCKEARCSHSDFQSGTTTIEMFRLCTLPNNQTAAPSSGLPACWIVLTAMASSMQHATIEIATAPPHGRQRHLGPRLRLPHPAARVLEHHHGCKPRPVNRTVNPIPFIQMVKHDKRRVQVLTGTEELHKLSKFNRVSMRLK